MTASITDPQSPAKLPSLTEALDLTVTTDPVDLTISVLYPNGDWDVVYQDGTFGSKYSGSERSGSVFQIRKRGGWPKGSKLYPKVKEATPAPTSLWTVLYDKDLRTLSNQTVRGSSGSEYANFTASDGSLWCMHASPGTCVVTNGTGIVMSATSRQQTSGINGYAGCRVSLRLPHLPGYDPTKRTFVQVRFSGTLTTSDEFGANKWDGTESLASSAAAQSAVTARIKYNSPSVTAHGVVSGIYDFDAVNLSGIITADYVSAVLIEPTFTFDSCFAAKQASTWCPPEDMYSIGCSAHSSFNGGTPTTGTKAGGYVGSSSGTTTLNMTHIRVLQRAALP